MPESILIDRLPPVNGTPATPAPSKPAKGRKASKATPRPASCSRRVMRHARRLALVAGGIATGVLALSVTHCTTAISDLTGSPWVLAALLAIGIDAGMVVSEVCEVTSHGTSAESSVRPWACGYTLTAIGLSMGLNGYAFAQHAAAGCQWAAIALGVIIPGLVYGLGRVAAHLWRAGE